MADLFNSKEVTTYNDYSSDALMAQVINQPDSENKLAILEKLIDLRNREIDRQAKLDFDSHFSDLRKALEPVKRNKLNDFLKSKYATLDEMQDVCDPIIHEHGFSYSWREEPSDGGKIVTMDITGYGHTRSNSFFCPEMPPITSRDGKQVTNILQVQGIMSSYGQRYTFKAGFGIRTKDADTDGQMVEIDEAMDSYRENIENAVDEIELKSAYQEAYQYCKGDKDKKALVIGWYNMAKAKLQEAK